MVHACGNELTATRAALAARGHQAQSESDNSENGNRELEADAGTSDSELGVFVQAFQSLKECKAAGKRYASTLEVWARRN